STWAGSSCGLPAAVASAMAADSASWDLVVSLVSIGPPVHSRVSAQVNATNLESIPLNFGNSRPIDRAATAAMGHTVLVVFNKTPQERRTVMVGFDELKGKASEALQNEEQTDSALDKAADFIDEKKIGRASCRESEYL